MNTTKAHQESGCTDYLQHSWDSCPENKVNRIVDAICKLGDGAISKFADAIIKDSVTGEGNAPRKLEVIEHDLPAYWASYLINGDDSGIEGKDQYEADKFLAEHNLPSPVSCEPAGIGRFNGLMCDMETYSFLV